MSSISPSAMAASEDVSSILPFAPSRSDDDTRRAFAELASTEARFARLDETLAASWQQVFARTRLVRAVERGEIDRRLYALYLFETYHYTLHNSRNQALVGVRALEHNGTYLKFCFEHACEEVGHEQMALHDIRSLGLASRDFEIPSPRAATEILIAYLYWISATGNPLRRLGYSFWAEGAYSYITPLVDRVQQVLELADSQLTFFIAHARIDEAHAREVREMIAQHCKTAEDWAEVERVMVTTLRLMSAMMEEAFSEYERLIAGEPSDYHFLLALE